LLLIIFNEINCFVPSGDILDNFWYLLFNTEKNLFMWALVSLAEKQINNMRRACCQGYSRKIELGICGVLKHFIRNCKVFEHSRAINFKFRPIYLQ